MLDALELALAECQDERKAHGTPKRADIAQLTGRYIFDHVESVLQNLIRQVKEST